MKRLTSLLLTMLLLLNMVPAAFAVQPEAGETENAPAAQAETAVNSLVDDSTVWSYLDNNTDPAGDSSDEGYDRTSWTAETFDDSAWKTAAGPFGSKRGGAAYDSTRTAATVLAGCDGQNDTPAYFFRTTFTIDSLEGYTKLVGSLEYDDGVIVYINGQRAAAGYDNACDASGNSLGHGFDANLQYGGSNAGPDTLEIELTDLSILHEGKNTIAVELHNGRATSSDVWFRMIDLFLSDEEVTYQTNISLSMGADESQMNFTWYSALEDASLTVADNAGLTGGRTVAAAVASANEEGMYSCKAVVTGLEAGTTYYYQLTNNDYASEVYSFTTGGSGSFSFAYVGDPQIGASGNAVNDTNGWDKTLNIIDSNDIFSGVSFLLSAGDQVNTASSESEYDGYLDHDALTGLPVATVIGNHDSGSNAYGQHFNVANESGTLGTTTAGGDSWFVYNNVLFLVLNSNDTSAAEHKEFMEGAIEATKDQDIQWKIVTFHHSIYTVASHSSDSYITDPTGFKNSMAPIFKDLDIDVVLQGHDHVYCRTYMMDGLTPITESDKYEYGNGADQAPTAVNDPEGILYVTANSGSGSKTYNIVNADFPFSAVQNQEHVANVSKIAVSDKQFTITTYRTTDMSVVDTFTIKRDGGDAEPAQTETEVVNSDTLWSYYDKEKDPVEGTDFEKYGLRSIWTYGVYQMTQDPNWTYAAGPFGAKNGQLADLGGGCTPKTLLNQYKEDKTDIEAYFFVTTFDLTADQLAEAKQVMGSLYYDDCAIVYLNHTKVASFDEPQGGFSKNMEYGGSNASAPKLGEFTLTDTNLLQEGTNVLAVELHQGRASSSDIYLDFQSLTLSTQEADYSDLALEQDTVAVSVGGHETEMNFSWYATTTEAGTITYAPAAELVEGELPETAATVTAQVGETNRGGYYSNQLTLTGLTPDTTYAYRLTNTKGDETVTSETATFTTGGGDTTSFLFVGDPQLGSSGNLDSDTAGWDDTLTKAAAMFPDATFLLSAGDQVDTANSEAHYQSYLNHTVLGSLPQATTIGNHDSYSGSYGQHFNVANESDTLGTTAAGGDSWFVYNGVLFMVLNSNDLSTAEHKQFMEQVLEETRDEDIQWKIVVFHHSIYSVASHALDTDILQRRDELAPVFKELDIDVVLMGHYHVYTRSYMMDGLTPMTDAALYDADYSSITDPTGILYVTANSGSGSKFYNISGQYAYAAVQNQEHVPNISYVEMDADHFTITTYRTSDMSVVDTFTINRTAAGGSTGGSGSGSGNSGNSGSTGTTAPETGLPFRDVESGDWFHDAVRYVYDKGMMAGTSETAFSPNLTTTRGMIVTILYRMAGSPAVSGETGFEDVAAGAYYAKAVTWAAENGIVAGYGDGRFGPNDPITREQMTAILYRYARFQDYNTAGAAGLEDFRDASAVSGYAVESMKWAVDGKLVSGMGDGTLAPQGSATRAQVAVILKCFCETFVK